MVEDILGLRNKDVSHISKDFKQDQVKEKCNEEILVECEKKKLNEYNSCRTRGKYAFLIRK